VTSVASGDFVVQKYDGSTETVDTTGSTSYAEPGNASTLPGVLDGENVAVTLDTTASSPTATHVVVFPERVSGRVTNVSGSTVTLSNHKGTDAVVVSPSTKYFEKGATPSSVSQGELVSAFGLPDSSTPGELDAQVIAIFGPQVSPQPWPHPQPQPAPAPAPQPQSPTPVTQSEPRPVVPATGATTQSPHVGAPTPQGGGPVAEAWGGHTQDAPSSTHGSWGGHSGQGGQGGSGGQGGFGGHH
jgi:hypothetical protein